MLEQEFQYFIDNQEEIVTKYGGKHVVIKGEEIIGVYDSELEAYEATKEEHEVGTFLIQKAIPGEEAYSQTFHSRVVFN